MLMLLTAVLTMIRQWALHRKVVRQLTRLTDGELRSLGIGRRQDISEAVAQRRFGR